MRAELAMYPILGRELDEAERLLLRRAIQPSYTGETVEEIETRWKADRLQIWRTETGIVVTFLNEYPSGRELVVWGIAGKGIALQFPAIFERMQEFAKAENCRWICGINIHRRLDDYYTRMGLNRVGTLFMKEIER